MSAKAGCASGATKILFLIVVLAFLPGEKCYGQLIKSFGVKAGINSAGEKYILTPFAMDVSGNRRVGITVAGFIEWLSTPSFSIVTELGYTQKGMSQDFIITSETDPDGTGQTITIDNRLDYISLPVSAKLRMQSEVISPYVMMGPRLDYFLGYSSDQNAFNLVYDDFKKATIGGSIGIGAQIEALLPFPLLIEARYNGDFINSDNNGNIEVSNNTFDFLVGVGF